MLHTLHIQDVQPAGLRARIVRVALVSGDLEFRAGQALLLGDHGASARRRAYSIAVAPADVRRERALEFLVGVDEQGSAGPHLTLGAGTLLDAEGPIGDLTVPDDADCVVFVAGGTGISAVRAMVRERLDGPARIRVVYSARTAADFAYSGELRRLASAGRIELIETVTRGGALDGWTGSRGRVGPAHVAMDGASAVYVLCGPLAMVCAVHDLLNVLGTAPNRIFMEQWCRRSRAATASN